MQEGVRHGDRCVCFIDDRGPVGGRARRDGQPTGVDRRRWHLGTYPSPDACSRPGGLSVEQLTSLQVADPGCTGGEFVLLRAAGEMSSVSQEPGPEKLSAYECAVTRIMAVLPAVFLCLYDLDRFELGMLVEVLRIHSEVLLEGAVLHNPHCVAPIAYPDATRSAAAHLPPGRLRPAHGHEGDRWLSLTHAEVRVAELVACGLTNRAAAAELVMSHHTVDAHLKHMYVKLGIHTRVELAVVAIQHRPTVG